ncbi:c-type cytochrome [Botryobacter ruber]|uniref:c-type cytochrome n=1 Tax=Botryobacter ruber TaxID=2171629 RepID=UPI001F0C8584|nr:cytochrome c [Botryobacter ruber]
MKIMKNKKLRERASWSAVTNVSYGLLLGALFLFGCSSGDSNSYDEYRKEQAETEAVEKTPEELAMKEGKGIGPVKEVLLEGGVINEELAVAGEQIYEGKCSACHQLSDQKVVGPGLAGVTKRRKPEWVMNMIVNPEEMTKKDPTAKRLLAEHLTQMTNQNVNEEDARAILEYLRKNDAAS